MTTSYSPEDSRQRDAGRQERAHVLRALHGQPPLVLPNAWDPGSAVAIEATATTSAGISWAAGVADGGGLGRAAALAALRRIVAVVSVPVTADIEAGYGASPEEVAATVAEVLAAGAVGVNIEDSQGLRGAPLLEPAAQAERLTAAREAARAAGVDLYVNARTAVSDAGVGEPGERLAATMARAERYAEAGADLLFVPGVTDPPTLRTLATGPLPLNVMAHPGAPTIPDLATLGITRITVGSAIAQSAYALAAAATRELLGPGTYGRLAEGMDYGELNALMG